MNVRASIGDLSRRLPEEVRFSEKYWASVSNFRETKINRLSFRPARKVGYEQKRKKKFKSKPDPCLIYVLICRSRTVFASAAGQETHPKFSLTHLLENCVEMGNNQNQIAVVNEHDEVIGVVTVSMLVKWIWQRRELYKDALETPIWRVRPFNKVVTMDEDAPAVDGFLKMAELGVGGIGITDKQGRLVDCLSCRDLRNIKPGSSRFSKLWNSCRAYKEAVINDRVKTPSVSCSFLLLNIGPDY